MIKFSYITITYNAEATLPATVASIMRQQYPCIEHIIVDGCSTDNTLNIAKQYQEESRIADNGHEIKIVSEPDKGIYDAMNKGLAMATGHYLCFLNAGDSLPYSLQIAAIANMLQQDTDNSDIATFPAVIYGETNLVDESRRYLGKRHLSPPKHLNWQSFKQGMLVCHQSFYARRDIAQKNKYNLAYRHSADFDWCIRVMKTADEMGCSFMNTGMVLTDYLNEGHTTKNHKSSLIERYHIMCKYYGTLPTILRHLWFFLRNLTK